VPGRTLWLTAVVARLVVQTLLLAPYHPSARGLLRAVAGMHVVNALLKLLCQAVCGLTVERGGAVFSAPLAAVVGQVRLGARSR
jgi:hypothetical protein